MPMVLLENVVGLLHFYNAVLDISMDRVRDTGNQVDFGVLNARACNLPQHRPRSFIIAIQREIVESALVALAMRRHLPR